MEEITSELIDKLIKDIQYKKEELLKNRLLEFRPNFDFEREKERRFKNIQCETDHLGNETYYYNDASLSGYRLITFENTMNHINNNLYDFEGNSINFGYEIKYY